MSTAAHLASSKDPVTSRAAALSGRKTLRIAWVSHLRGKREANCCIQVGRFWKMKNTPDVNCSTRTIGLTTADAPLAFFGTTLNAMPSSVHDTRPSTDTHTNVNH